ncbi:hypothetical protein HRbin17_00138 [bacterium HR17]|uniref:Uncharacterized protein n=1 Tax=Candidatus Fervidibacter japonicus TaxID=2035412 RepID=A0A2H5X8Y4_9BACT|nr:hypothetical protein HRbin17_00138 [bacterium HR17]
MEALLWEMVGSLTRQPSVSGFLTWTSLVGATIWLPSVVPPHLRGFVHHLCSYSLFGIVAMSAVMPLRASAIGSPMPLLELTALGLAAAWAWLERSPKHRAATQERSTDIANALQQGQRHDLLNAVRLALWATLSLMPAVHWF